MKNNLHLHDGIPGGRNRTGFGWCLFAVMLLLPGMAPGQFAPDPSIGRNLPDSIPEAAPDAFVHRPSELETRPDYADVPIIGKPGTGILRKVIISGALTPGDRQEGITVVEGIQVDRVDLLATEHQFAESLRAEYINHPFDLEAARAITRRTLHFYFKHEHPLVFVQPVSIDYERGILHLVIVEATLDRKIDTGAKWFSKKLLLASLRAKVGEHLNRMGLLNDVAILNQNPFMQNSAVLKRGDAPGTTTLDLQTKDSFPVKGFFSIDNTGSQQTGPWRWSAGANWGNAFFLGGQLSYQYSAPFASVSSQPVQSLSYFTPLPWKHLLSFYASYSTTSINLNSVSSELNYNGYTAQISPRYTIPIGKMYGKLIQNILLGADWISSNLYFRQGGNQIPSNQTDIAQAVFGYEGRLKDKFGQTGISPVLYWSPGGIDPRNSTAAFRNVDPRTQANYLMTTLRVNRDTDLPFGCHLVSLFTGQIANASLPSTEQFSIGGYGSVRGYPQQILFGDQGYFFNLEIWSPAVRLLGAFSKSENPISKGIEPVMKVLGKDQLRFLAFWDYGMVNSLHPLPGNPSSYDITGVGIGVRYSIGANYSLRCDLGFPLVNPNVGVTIGPTINAGASVSF